MAAETAKVSSGAGGKGDRRRVGGLQQDGDGHGRAVFGRGVAGAGVDRVDGDGDDVAGFDRAAVVSVVGRDVGAESGAAADGVVVIRVDVESDAVAAVCFVAAVPADLVVGARDLRVCRVFADEGDVSRPHIRVIRAAPQSAGEYATRAK